MPCLWRTEDRGGPPLKQTWHGRRVYPQLDAFEGVLVPHEKRRRVGDGMAPSPPLSRTTKPGRQASSSIRSTSEVIAAWAVTAVKRPFGN